ncbi:MAG: PilZ domain-containing protein [Isosphaeraceae bacterium]
MMSAAVSRAAERLTSPSVVWVNKLSGDRPLKGSLVGLTSTGVRLILDRPLESGEVIRLVFARQPGEVCYQGQTIIGQVRQSRNEAGRHIVGVAFGWATGCNRKRSPRPPKAGWWSWLRACCWWSLSSRPAPSRQG